MPKYLFIIAEEEQPYATPDPQTLDEVMAMHNDFSAAVVAAGGKILGGEALLPSSTATFLRNTRTDAVAVVDNPAPDLKEVLGGYYLIETADEATALDLAKRCPAPYGHIEMRPIWEFGEA